MRAGQRHLKEGMRTNQVQTEANLRKLRIWRPQNIPSGLS
jgi:hypothetical protein